MSFLLKQFLETTSYNITIIDNFKTGFEDTIRILNTFGDFNFINQDLSQWDKIDEIFKEGNLDEQKKNI